MAYRALRARRTAAEVAGALTALTALTALAALADAAAGTANLVPPILGAVKALATVGEIADVMRKRFGEYQPARYPPVRWIHRANGRACARVLSAFRKRSIAATSIVAPGAHPRAGTGKQAVHRKKLPGAACRLGRLHNTSCSPSHAAWHRNSRSRACL